MKSLSSLMKEYIHKIFWILSSQLGIDPRKFISSIIGIPKFISDYISFTKLYKGKINILPCFSDWMSEGGSTKSEYFWQDIYVAKKVFDYTPLKHVDIGSRVDSFVAHVASFREIEIFDIRPINAEIPGVTFKKADLMNISDYESYCDSLSCLHALEHFGLGRYGDPINVDGYKHGLVNMASILKPGGIFYLSVPTGFERVEFNAHRIFNPISLVEFTESLDLSLSELAWIDPVTKINVSKDHNNDLNMLANQNYMLAMFTFMKR